MNFRRLVCILICIGMEADSAAGIVLSADFSEPDGPAIVSAPLWLHHSGATGELKIENSQLHLLSSQTEDIHAPLTNGPWDSAKTPCLYASFSIRCDELPGKAGGYFLHWMDSKNSHRCRVFALSAGAAEGCFRLGLSNGSSTPDITWPLDLPLNRNNTVVLKYDLAGGTSTLWLDPVTEKDASITAQDSVTAGAITDLAIRQASGIGSIWIDDLRAATQFSEVSSGSTGGETKPVITRQPQSLMVSEGAAADLAVVVQNPGSAAFQWVWNGTSLDGETNAALHFPHVSKTQEGSYWVIVSSRAESIESEKAALTVTNSGPVEPNAPFVLEKFDYPDGPLCEVSAGIWRRHSGSSNEIAVAAGRITLSELASEDASMAIPGAPLASNACVYAGFSVTAVALPSGADGNYFAHFKDGGSGYRCRVFAIASDTAAGCWRLGISSTNNTAATILPAEIVLGQPHRVVVKWDSALGASSLWMDPRDENDPCAVASDSGKASVVSSFAFRQSMSSGDGMGVLRVDDLAIGPSLRSVLMETVVESVISLQLERSQGAGASLRWAASPSRTYSIWRTEHLEAGFALLQSGLSFADGVGFFIDETSGSEAVGFYRVSSP